MKKRQNQCPNENLEKNIKHFYFPKYFYQADENFKIFRKLTNTVTYLCKSRVYRLNF